jgi:rhamnosyltransferase
MKPLASVIIPALNEEKNIKRCLSAVFSQRTDFEFEALLVDSGSTDRTVEAAREFEKNNQLRILEIARKDFNHGRTRQFASEQAGGDFLVYLVADAEPADKDWLSRLVGACKKDERIAGAYSRQIARPGAGIIERLRLSKRTAGKAEARVAELASPDDYWMLEPLARILLCDFDDVSSVRRRSVLARIPIPACAWAEDLVWSRECLMAGLKIAYEPGSAVYHSHELSSRYLFKRGWIDQKAAAEYFGQVYYPDSGSALAGYFIALGRELKEVMTLKAPAPARLAQALKDPVFVAAEILGRRLAQTQGKAEPQFDLRDDLADSQVTPRNALERVARSAFAIGNDFREVILANPPADIGFDLFISEAAELRFGIGVKPEAFRLRKAPIDFKILIEGEEVFKARLEMSRENLTAWKDFSVPLEKWRGKDIRISLVTESEDISHGWAAWAAPGIYYKNHKIRPGLDGYLARRAEALAGPGNFRHN